MKSDEQITRERKAWARGKLIVAWLTISKAAADTHLALDELKEHEAALFHARAIAEEWGIDCRQVIEELDQEPARG